jgi:hypothetical protein
MDKHHVWRNLPNEKMLPERTARHVLNTKQIENLCTTYKTISVEDIRKGIYKIPGNNIAFDTFIPDADTTRIIVDWNHYKICYIPIRITTDYVKRASQKPTIRGAKFRHNVHIFRQAMKNEVSQKPTNGENLWSLAHIVHQHHEEHMEVLPCECRQMKDCEICNMNMTYENLQLEIADAANKIDYTPQERGKNQQKWRTWAKKMQKMAIQNGTKALMLMTAMLIMGNLTKKIPYARAADAAIGNFVFKDLGSFTLHPTHMPVIKVINHIEFVEQYEKLSTLKYEHEKICNINITEKTMDPKDKIRTSFDEVYEQFALSHKPRNNFEAKQFCESKGGQLPEIRTREERSAILELIRLARPDDNNFPAGIRNEAGIQEAIYLSDGKVATTYMTNLLPKRFDGIFPHLCQHNSAPDAHLSLWNTYIDTVYPIHHRKNYYYKTYKPKDEGTQLDLCPHNPPKKWDAKKDRYAMTVETSVLT